MAELRGNGKAAAHPQGVLAFTDAELAELRQRIERSRLTAADLVAWDALAVFGLRPSELQGLELTMEGGVRLAHVSRQKKSSKGSSGARTVPAVPPADWPIDCFNLVERWRAHGIPPGMAAAWSPGEVMAQHLECHHG
jgi:hypothetical protein